MAIADSSTNIVSKHWLRMPVPDAGADFELFIFTGIAIFDDLKGTGNSWIDGGGTATIMANYSRQIPQGKAILPRHWTVDVHLAKISNDMRAINTGWAVDQFSLTRVKNNLGGGNVAVDNGILRVKANIDIRDIDAFILRLSYHVTILGKVVDFAGKIIE